MMKEVEDFFLCLGLDLDNITLFSYSVSQVVQSYLEIHVIVVKCQLPFTHTLISQ